MCFLPLILSMANVTWKRTIDPSRKNRSHTRRRIFMWRTDENTVTNQCRVISEISMSCSRTTLSTPGRYVHTKAAKTRWSACTPVTTKWYFVNSFFSLTLSLCYLNEDISLLMKLLSVLHINPRLHTCNKRFVPPRSWDMKVNVELWINMERK